jgi:ParB family chromosome partitioning protein
VRKSLGKGLTQLLGEQFEGATQEAAVDAIVPNPRQPRTNFEDAALRELAASVKEYGVLNPLTVRPLSEGKYELIAGERRLRAAKLAGLKSVPVVIRAAGDQGSLELAMIENVQREDINAMEAARAYRRLMDEFGLTQDAVADKVGKARPTIANSLRLLKLPPKVQEGLHEGRISEGHARALLAFPQPDQQMAMYNAIVDKGLSVREVERAAQPADPKRRPRKNSADPNLVALERSLSEKLGAPVKIASGRIEIAFFGDADLERLLEVLGA